MDKKILKSVVKEVMQELFTSRWLTTKEAVKYSKLSEKTLRKFYRQGEIYAVQIGNKLIWDKESIDNFLLQDEKKINLLVKEILKK